jgi:hypothetical protein
MKNFNTSRFKDASAIWQTAVKSRSQLSLWLSRAIPIIVGSNSLSWVKAGSHFSSVAYKLYRNQGSRGLAIYLKAANLLLIRATSGKGLSNSRDAGCAVSCTNSGLPRIIVPIHRARILAGESSVIRLWLGFFTLYRVLDFRGKLSLDSVVKPGIELSDMLISDWKWFLRIIFLPMLRKLGVHPLDAELTHTDVLGTQVFNREKSYWFFRKLEGTRLVIQTSGPSSAQGVNSASIFGHGLDCWNWINSSVYPYLHSMCLLTGNIHFLTSEPFKLAYELQSRCHIDQTNGADPHSSKGWTYPWVVDVYRRASGPDQGLLGSLSIREEPGKLRVFAMVDSLTQWVLRPLHDRLFKWLSKIPQDGTFNQTKPVEALLATMKDNSMEHVWSYDLSAATDRIPLLLQEYLLGYLISPMFAYSWSRLLTERLYKVPRIFMTTFGVKGWLNNPLLKSSPVIGAVRYAVGQPMGAYSSWAMLAFVHHAIVQWAAYRVGFREWFSLYAVLGDDIVIAHREVASEYVSIMTRIGVSIGFHKSVISNNRSLEFAKRYYYKGVEVTPLPLLGIATGWLGVSMVPEVISVVERLTGKILSSFQIARFVGVGFKAASGADHNLLTKMPRRLRSLLILLLHPGAPRATVDLWSWLRAKSLTGQVLTEPKSVDAMLKYIVAWARESRFPRLLELLKTHMKMFVPGRSFEPTEAYQERFATWFTLYIREPLEQEFMIRRIGIEMLVGKMRSAIMPSNKDVNDLLTELEELEEEISLIPKMVVRHKSQLAETSVPLLPSLVKRWMDLGRFLSRASSSSKRVMKNVNKGTGASPLLRTK